MADKSKSKAYSTHVSGFWNSSHEFREGDEVLGTLKLRRNLIGIVVSGKYTPAKGEVLVFRRDPGILGSQFSLWTEHREWLGSALRWSFFARVVNLSTGSKALRMISLSGFRRGWRLMAPKTGELARISARPFQRNCQINVHRRIDFDQVLFAYFLGTQLLLQSWWPGPAEQESTAAVPATS
ncbi:MAG: hypothetical protein ACI8X5_001743 [Planctomycetota bacterium]|jgi:hypothetical protein